MCAVCLAVFLFLHIRFSHSQLLWGHIFVLLIAVVADALVPPGRWKSPIPTLNEAKLQFQAFRSTQLTTLRIRKKYQIFAEFLLYPLSTLKIVFWLKFHWSLFLMVQLTITQHWYGKWCCTNNNLIHGDIYVSLGHNVLTHCLSASGNYLSQCWLTISKVQWHSSGGNFTKVTPAITP